MSFFKFIGLNIYTSIKSVAHYKLTRDGEKIVS